MTLKNNRASGHPHLFCTMSSFVHHFKAIGEFKLELQSGNAQFGSKLVIFFVPCDLEIWWMTLENNRATLIYFLKLRASFQSHQWIQTVTVRKCLITVKIGNFLSCVTLKFEILCLTKSSIWTAFTYLVKAFWKKGISEIDVRFGARSRLSHV